MKLFKLARLNKLAKVFRSMEDTLHINSSMLRLLRLMFNLILCAHLLACAWWYVKPLNQHQLTNLKPNVLYIGNISPNLQDMYHTSRHIYTHHM
jgi:hypothetical protein